MRPPTQRFTRGQMHRVLKFHGIDHDVNWGAEALYNLIIRHGINTNIQPGVLEQPKSKADEIAELKRRLAELEGSNVIPIKASKKKPEVMKDGWPRSVFVLRKMCREQGVPCQNTDKRHELIAKLNNG